MDVLWNVQRKQRQIDHDSVTKISQAFGMSRMELEGIITFYHFYHKTHAGKFTIYLNDCIIATNTGMQEVQDAFVEALGIPMGKVTDDHLFGLFQTQCIGLSDQEPACLINFKPFTRLTREKVFDIVKRLKNGENPADFCDKVNSKIQYTPKKDHTVFMKPYKNFSTLANLSSLSPEELIQEITNSKLAGRGGAFFPTGMKWDFCRKAKANTKYVICNADEGEPGTFKDRVLLQEHPELLVEGMICAAYAAGASQGIIYLRAEYLYLKEALENLLKQYRKNGFLGKKIQAKIPFDFDIRIHMGAGAYVCGEETALIHSLEGKRGEPGTKEYFPTQKGFLGQPTVVNNVETLCAVPRILEMGVKKWLSLGTPKTPGTKLLSVSGDCKKEGLYEIEWGMTLKELLQLTGAKNTKMVQFSGPSGESLSAADFDRKIAGEDLSCGGSVMIFDKDKDILLILKQFSDFFVAESCGLCVPCRTGNFLLNQKIQKLILGHAEQKDLEEIKAWSQIIKTTSRCGLGQMSSNSLNAAIEKFPELFDKVLSKNSDFNKSFKLEEAVNEYDLIIKEIRTSYE